MMTNSKNIIDCHVHLAALPDGENGCFISKNMLNSPALKFVAWRQKIPLHDPARANALYLDNLRKTVEESRTVKRAVLLGLDGVYGSNGKLDNKKTEFLISNDYVLDAVRKNPDHFLAGISINPQRRDAVDEIERCAAEATLIKVLPNTQSFDPAEKSHVPFYRTAAKRKIPLLTHVGFEFTLWGKDQSVGDLARWRAALEEGATVIAAHGAGAGTFLFEKHWDTLLYFVEKYEAFYWDASALGLPNRVGMLMRLRRHPALHSRMVFGTDYPLPCPAYPALLAGKFSDYAALFREKNPFDRHYGLLEILGFKMPSPDIFLETIP